MFKQLTVQITSLRVLGRNYQSNLLPEMYTIFGLQVVCGH